MTAHVDTQPRRMRDVEMPPTQAELMGLAISICRAAPPARDVGLSRAAFAERVLRTETLRAQVGAIRVEALHAAAAPAPSHAG
jgi:hypothetical protein